MTNSKNRIVLAVLAAVVAFGGYYMVVLKPKRQEASDLKNQVTAKQAELQQARDLLAANTQARESYRQAYAAVVRLGKAVPADDDVRSLVVQLDSAAKASHVDFRTISVGGSSSSSAGGAASEPATQLPPGATVGPAGFPVMPFSFAFKGSFFSLGDFFDKLESFVSSRNQQISVTGRLLTLDSLNLQPDTTGFPNIKATVSATSYLVSPLEGLTGGATAQGPAGTATGSTPNPSTTGKSAPAPTSATSIGVLR